VPFGDQKQFLAVSALSPLSVVLKSLFSLRKLAVGFPALLIAGFASAVYRRVAHRKMALSEAAIPCLRWRFRLVKAGGYKPEAPAKAISEAPRRPDNPSATPL
jgi:hypothetical protein